MGTATSGFEGNKVTFKASPYKGKKDVQAFYETATLGKERGQEFTNDFHPIRDKQRCLAKTLKICRRNV